MIDLSDQPYIVTLADGTEAADEGQILLLGISGPDQPRGLILAAKELSWQPLENIVVETQLVSYQLVEEAEELVDTPEE